MMRVKRFNQLLRKRISSDHGAATLVVGIVSVAFLCLCLGMGLDLTKNAYLKNAQHSKAQEAVEVAVKTVDSKGSLANFTRDQSGTIPDAVYAVRDAYRSQNSSSYNNSLVGQGDHTDDTVAYSSDKCNLREITKWGSTGKSSARIPYMVVKISKDRGFDDFSATADSVVFTMEGDDAPVKVAGNFDPSISYHVVSAEIQDASANFMMGMFGMGCQGYNSKVSAISFASQQDLAENN